MNTIIPVLPLRYEDFFFFFLNLYLCGCIPINVKIIN